MAGNYFAQPNPWQVMAGAGGNGDLSQLPMMIQRQKQYQQEVLMRQQEMEMRRQQMEYQQKLATTHGELFKAQTAYTQKRGEAEQQKMNQAKALIQSAGVVGNATTMSKMLQGGGSMDLANPAATGLMDSGALPSSGFQMSRDDLIHALNAIAAGGATENAVSQPASAERMMAGYNIPEGGVRANPIEGVTQYGMPKPVKKNLHNVPMGGRLFDDDGNLIAQGEDKPSNSTKPMTQGEAFGIKAAEGCRTYAKMPEPFRLAVDYAATNAPAISGQPQRVRVRSKDGQVGTIPVEQLQEALGQGYTQVQ